jgi:hypothetical protein
MYLSTEIVVWFVQDFPIYFKSLSGILYNYVLAHFIS